MARIRENNFLYDFEDNGAFEEEFLTPFTPAAPLSQVAPVAPTPAVQSPLSPPAPSRYNISSPDVQAQVYAAQEAARLAQEAEVAKQAQIRQDELRAQNAARLASEQEAAKQAQLAQERAQAEAQARAQAEAQARAQEQARLQAEAQARAQALAAQQEAARQAQMAQQAEAVRQAQLVEQARQSELARQSQLAQRQAELAQQEQARIAESQRQAQLAAEQRVYEDQQRTYRENLVRQEQLRAQNAARLAAEQEAAQQEAARQTEVQRQAQLAIQAEERRRIEIENAYFEQQARAQAEQQAEQQRQLVLAQRAQQVEQERLAAEQAERNRQGALQQAEAARQAEIAKQAETQRQAELAQQAEQQRLGALQQAEAARQAQQAAQLEQARQVEAQRQAELTQQAEAQRQAELAQQVERDRQGALQKAEAERVASLDQAPVSGLSATRGLKNQNLEPDDNELVARTSGLDSLDKKFAELEKRAEANQTPEDRKNIEIANNLATQILGQKLTDKWTGQGFGNAEANARDMGKILASIGITDIKQFGKVPQYEQAVVQQGYNGKPAQQDEDGNYFIVEPSGQFDSEGNEIYGRVNVDPSKLEKIYGTYQNVSGNPDEGSAFVPTDKTKVVIKNGVPMVETGTTFGNKQTGQAVPNTYSERQTGDFFGGTFAGSGNTGYGVKFDAQGNPLFYTQGASSNDLANLMQDLGPIGQIAIAVATGGLSIPQQIAANMAIQVLSGKDIGDAIKGAAISFAGSQIPGMEFMQDGASFIKDLGLSEAVTNTLTKSFQNAAVSAGTALISGEDVGQAMLRGAATGGVNGAVNALLGNIEGFGELTSAQQKIATNAVTGLISGKPLDQIVINSAIDAANAEVAKARNAGKTEGTTTRGITTQGTTNQSTADNEIAKELDKQLTIDASGARDANAAAEFAQAQGYNKFIFDGKTYTLDNNNAANTIAQLEADALKANTAANLKGGEFEGVDAAVAANAAQNNTNIGNTEADTLEEAAALARSRNPTGTTFTYGGQTYTLGASNAAVTQALNQVQKDATLDNIKNAKTFNEAFATARAGLGAGQTFTWQGKEYSTATAAERPDLSTPSISEINARNLATSTDASKTVAAQSDTAARETAAQELAKQQEAQKAASTNIEKTGFWSGIADKIQDTMKLSSAAANDYLKNNPNSPITNSVSTAYEAAGNMQKNIAGGAALVFDNKPLADALVKSGDDLTKFGQSIGNGVVDTKNWNDTMSLLQNAKGLEKVAILAGRVMDGNSGLGRQVEVELRQELPGLFLGGGSVKGIMLATGAMDTLETGGNQALETYDDEIKKGKTHAQALESARIAGGVAAMTEAALQLTLGKLADFGAGKIGNVAVKGGTKVIGQGGIEGIQESGAGVAVDLALGNALDANKYITQGIVGTAVGKGTAVATSPADIATNETINNAISTAVNSGDPAGINSAITNSVQQSLTNGASVDTAVGTTIGAAITNGADATSSITTAVTSAVTSGADSTQVVNSAVTSAVTAGADVTTTVTSAVQAAVTAGADVTTATTSATTAAVTASINSGADVSAAITSSVSAAVTSGADVTTATTTATTAAVTASINSGADVTTAVTSAVSAAVTAGGDVTTVSNAAVTTAVNTSVTSGADVATTITNSVQAAVTAGANASTAATTATTAAVTASINAGADTTTSITTAVSAAVDAGATVTAATNAATTAAVTTSITAGVDTSTAITTSVDAAVTAGADVTTATNTAVTAAVTASVTAGADTTTAINTSVTAAVTSGADVTTAVTIAVTAAVDASVTQAVTNGTDVSTAITNSVTSSISSAVTNDTSVTTAVETAVSTAISSAVTNNADVTAAVTSSVSSAITSAIEGKVDSSTAITTAVDSAVTTAIESNVDSNTAITTAVDSAITTAVNANTDANVNTVANDAVTSAVEAAVNSGVDVNTAVNAAVNAAINANINTNINIDVPALVKSAVETAKTSSELVDLRNSVNELIAKVSAIPATPATPEPTKPTKTTTPAQSSGLNAGLLAGVMSAKELERLPPQMLKAYMTQDKFVDPLAKLQALQEDMNTEKMQPKVNTQDTEMPDQGTWKYGNAPDDIDTLFGEQAEEGEEANFAAGGYVAPLQMASGGAMPLPLLVKSGGALGALPRGDGRLDFRHGAHVAGEGDGQSDDIKAMLADGEFVFPADVVSALGNGSTKAGSDKLYEMMHSIRARARSKKPKDLPPPALKSPLDYLKKQVRSK